MRRGKTRTLDRITKEQLDRRDDVNRRLLMIVTLLIAAFGGLSSVCAAQPQNQRASRQDHIAWVSDALKRMQAVRVGMTRDALLKVFATEGGLSTGLRRTFVSRDCPYFKVDVEFEAVGRPSRDSDGRVTLVEGNQDVIVKISKPYLQFSVAD